MLWIQKMATVIIGVGCDKEHQFYATCNGKQLEGSKI